MSLDTSANVRPLQTTDRQQWQQLWSQYLAFYKQNLPQATTDLAWSRLMEGRELWGFAGLDAAGHMVGFTHYHFHLSTWSPVGYCYLEDLFVDPRARGRHIGRSLIEAVYKAADERGVTRVYWHTENTNARAQVLYNQVGQLSPFLQFRRPPR
ncbi:GNAT family N-acetyltransferase [Steroidobacter sp.]|uniref:GNAT family N-acetyltransferase n=1 Tax=Steroidobacter sp. TaxID=1978227 RepID=UPI001A4222CC|nr:GNAT family N-acetyltransferase [Steroidobacter sp.]MBL8265562.1 GNAT family N-acetyltransferase [Steroidobacter sp.]